MAVRDEQPVEFDGPAGALVGIVHAPDGGAEPRGVAVVCHPHPLHEGTMDNKVVHTLARTFAATGIAALRFNFRGVGESAGEYDDGNGEVGDALAAIRLMHKRHGALPLWLAGFSFGSYIALRASATEAPVGLVLAAPAVKRFDFTQAPLPDCPVLVLQGDADDVAPPDAVIAWVNDTFPSPELVLLPGVGHFFHGQLTQVREIVSEFIGDA